MEVYPLRAGTDTSTSEADTSTSVADTSTSVADTSVADTGTSVADRIKIQIYCNSNRYNYNI